MTRSRSRAAAVVVVAMAMAVAGCKKKGDGQSGLSAELTGLAAVPASAEVLIAVDVGRFAESPIVERAVEQLLLRDPDLAARWQDLRGTCKLEINQLRRIMLARGPVAPGGRPGTGPALMVATGQISEPDIVKCVREMVGKGGGSLVVKTVEGRSLYQVKAGNRTMFLAFGRADTVVLGTSDAYVNEALGAGKKAADHPEIAAWLKLVDQRAPLWAVGRVPELVRTGLVRVTQNQLKAGPSGFVATADLAAGAKLELGAVMASPEDAKALESIAKAQLIPMIWGAQLKSLGGVVKKVAIVSDGSIVRIKAALTMDDVNHVLSVLDGGGPPAQDRAPSAPPAGSASSTPPGAAPPALPASRQGSQPEKPQ
jgi:hypothetical protein